MGTAFLDFSKPHVLRCEAEYDAAIAEIERLLDEVMGGKSRVSKFLNGKRDLCKSQVEGLRRLLGTPADVLLGLDA